MGSRKDVRALIRSGRVAVADKVVRDPAYRVPRPDPHISVDGRKVRLESRTYMLNKPQGLITASTDPRRPTVLDLFPDPIKRRVFPAGRLDKDTEGLLIVTDDGDLCHRLISPKHNVEKEYWARLDGPVDEAIRERFAAGVLLRDGYVTRPAVLTVEPSGDTARVIVTEGKYHQVRRMFAACGRTVVELKRLRIGTLVLDPALAPGAYRPLEADEIAKLLA